METPELPKGYFFEVVPGSYHGYYNTQPLVIIRKRLWYFWSTKEYTVRLTEVAGPHPTPSHVHRAMLRAKAAWEENQEKSKIYGQYPPKKLKDLFDDKETT